MKISELLAESEAAPSGAAMLAKVDMLLQNTGIKREGFKLVKDPKPQGMVRGSISQEAIDMVKATLAKAKAMGATDSPDPKPIMNPADVPNSAFTEEATAGGTSAGSIASIASVPGAKRKVSKKGKYGAPKAPQATNADGTAKNAQDMDTNLMGGATVKR